MFKDKLREDNTKLLSLLDKIENKDEILDKMKLQMHASILILSIICVVSIACTIIDSRLIIPIVSITALIYLVTSLILIRCRVIDVEHVVIIGVIYVLLYLCISCRLLGVS